MSLIVRAAFRKLRVHQHGDGEQHWEQVRAAAPAFSRSTSVPKKLTPVTLPPGRLRLATKPALTGSPPIVKTIGIVVVAALAAKIELPPPVAAITATLRRDQIGRKCRQSIVLVSRPSGIRSPRSGLRHSRLHSSPGGTHRKVGADRPAQAGRNPITGIAGCCARAASGHAAAAPPSSVMNSRRFIRSPRRRAERSDVWNC